MSRKVTPGNPNLHRKSACDLFTAEYEINDIRPAARVLLTKGQTQDEISQYAGASISTRGRFVSVAEKRSGNPINDRSLYLFIQGNTKDSVDLAVQKIEEIIQMDGQANYRSKFPNNNCNTSTSAVAGMPHQQQQPPQMQMTMPPPGGMAITSTTNTMHTNSTCVEKIFIGLDHAPPTFDLRSRLIGTGGANLNYIRTETGAMATLRGRGSLFVEPMLSIESPEPIHLYIEHLRYEGLQAAKQLARNLIETLQQELIQFQQMNPPLSNIHYSAQTTVVQQPHIYTQHTMTQPPPPPAMMAMPPPQPHPHIATAVQSTTATLMQTHQLPLQLHPHAGQSLVQIQPNGLQIPMKTLVPAGATAGGAPPHLSQPPPSLQHLQHSGATQTQIVVNQSMPIPIKTMVPMVQTTPQPNYQYQYIHTTGQEATAVPQPAAGPSGAVTIQHIYQSQHPSLPPQHVQSIMQPTSQFSDVTTTTFAQQMIRPPPISGQQPPPQPQYITVQGNTAYMSMPPPNIIQTTTQVPTSSMIYSSLPPPQMLQQPPNYSMAQAVHQVITVQQQAPGTEVKMEDKQEVDCGKMDEFSDGQQRSTIVSALTAPPPIMSVPPPTVQHHIMVPNSYAQQTHLYGGHQVPMSHAAPSPVQQQQQQFVINSNGWPPHSMVPQTSQQHAVHLSQPPATAMHGIPVEYRSGSGGTTYQQIQHPIMTTATTSMAVQYPQMPPMMKMNHQVPPPPFGTCQGGGGGGGPPSQQQPPPQPVPFPMQQQQQQQAQENNNNQNIMMRSGQKRKLMDDNGGDGVNQMPNKNGHGDPNSRHPRMTSGGGGGPPYGSQVDFVATSSAANAVGGGGGRVGTMATSNTNSSNDLNQDNYAATVHRLDERNHSVNQMTMPGPHGGEIGDHSHQNCEQHDDGPPPPPYQNDYPGGDLSHPPPTGGPLPGQQQMSMVRCNIMGKPPPPLPQSTSILAQQQMPRYTNQW